MPDMHPAEAAYMATIRAGADWYTAADKAVAELAKARRPFTADDARDVCGAEPEHPNALGGLFRYWKGRGLIRHVGFARSRKAVRKASVVGVWQGNDIA